MWLGINIGYFETASNFTIRCYFVIFLYFYIPNVLKFYYNVRKISVKIQGVKKLAKVKRFAVMLIFFVFLWVTVNDSINAFNVISGFLLCGLSIYISSKLLLINYVKEFSLPLFKTLHYIIFMFCSIYKAGITATISILKGDVKPTFTTVKIDEKIKSTFLHNIIANSVTLTPGTITVENNEGNLTIMCLHKNTAKQSPINDFEPFMKSIQNSLNNAE